MKFKTAFFVLLPIIVLILLLSIIFSMNAADSKASIESGELAYSCNCGWISWDHALPGGVKKLIKKVVDDTLISRDTKEITYAQSMKINFIGKSKMVAGISRKYVVSGELSDKEREETAFIIFRQTSESFERMQGSFPFNLIEGSQSSSFKAGDLTGNKIAFYRALRGYSKEDIVKFCKPVSKDKSIARLQKSKYGKQTNWQPEQEGVYPEALNEIRTNPNLSDKELIFIKESKNLYIDF